MSADLPLEQYLELAQTRDALILDLAKKLDADLVMLAKAEHATEGGSTTVSSRATKRLMALVSLVAPTLIDVNPDGVLT